MKISFSNSMYLTHRKHFIWHGLDSTPLQSTQHLTRYGCSFLQKVVGFAVPAMQSTGCFANCKTALRTQYTTSLRKLGSRAFSSEGKHWKGWIARAKKHAVLQRHNKILLERWHEQLFDDLREAGFEDLHACAERRSDAEHPFACGPCKQVFRTYTAWCTHAHKKHGRSDPLRHFLHDGKCKCCLSDYHTTRRLLAHLHHDRRCAINHVALSEWRELGPGRGATQEDMDRALPLPVLRPPCKTHILADEEEDVARATEALTDYTFRTRLASTTRQCSAQRLPPAEVSEEIRRLLLQSVVNIGDAWDEIVALLNSLPDSDPVTEGLRLTTDLWSLSWLFWDCLDEVTWPVAAYRNLNLRDAKTAV